MGTADLKAAFGDKRHELNVSTHQMCVLLLFNEADSLAYGEIAEVGSRAQPDGCLPLCLCNHMTCFVTRACRGSGCRRLSISVPRTDSAGS